MGSKGGAPASASPSHAPAICCMCGDNGLRQELFRCQVCVFRSQHKYCSDLYPKAEAYRACNWCLREEGAGKAAARGPNTDHNSSGVSSPSSIGGGSVKLHRGAFPSHLNKPIKKQRVPEGPSPDGVRRVRSEELSPSSGKGRKDFRAKVRRYKLLEEVSS